MRFGQDSLFFDLLEQQAQMARQASQQFQALSQDLSRREEIAASIKKLESAADDLTHEVVNKADAKFITPFDKEDIHALTHALDDLTDHIEAAAARVAIYNLDKPRLDFASSTSLLAQAVDATAKAVAGLRNLHEAKQLAELFKRVHDLENQTDEVYRNALAELFNDDNANPILVMKWKEIYDHIEIAADQCENIADILESMVVKYA